MGTKHTTLPLKSEILSFAHQEKKLVVSGKHITLGRMGLPHLSKNDF